jgi:capsular polysaccharide biosynthesis protein/Mrp family chromosome partitioning ATPase
MRNGEVEPRDSNEPEFPLTLGYYLGLLARRWWLPVSLAVLCACLALAYTGVQDVKYEARATILLSPLDPETADELGSLTPTVARLIRSDSILLAAGRAYSREAARPDEPAAPADLRSRTAVRVPRDTSLFEVAATGPTQQDANTLVRAIVEAATQQISSLAKRRTGLGAPRLSFAGFGPPVPQGQVSPTPTRNLVVGTNVGLLLGIVGALLLRDPRRSRMRADHLAQLLKASDVVYAPLPSPRLLLNRPSSAVSLRGSASEPVGDRNAEGIRLLGGRLWQWLQRDRHVVLLAGDLSPKSLRFVALKLAAHLARTGIRPLVVEADYHGEPWETGSRDRVGLGNALEAKKGRSTAPEPIAVETTSQNGDGPGSFAVVPRGKMPPEPALAFASDRYRSVLKRLVAQHEVVLVVGPPSDWQAELLALAESSDGVVLLVPAWVAHSRAAALATLRSVEPESSVVVSVFGDPDEMPLAASREV